MVNTSQSPANLRVLHRCLAEKTAVVEKQNKRATTPEMKEPLLSESITASHPSVPAAASHRDVDLSRAHSAAAKRTGTTVTSSSANFAYRMRIVPSELAKSDPT